MAITSLVTFNNAIQGMSISGVTQSLAYQPEKIDTADCPLQFPRRVRSQENPLTADGQGGWPRMDAEFWIVVSPVLQSTNQDNHSLMITLMEATAAALRAQLPGVLGKSKTQWTLSGEPREIYPGALYWVVICTVVVNG
jgi:hypothetical protein